MSEMAERKGGSDERGQGRGEEGCEEGGRGARGGRVGGKRLSRKKRKGDDKSGRQLRG